MSDENSESITCQDPMRSFKTLEGFCRMQGSRVKEIAASMEAFISVPQQLYLSLKPMDTQQSIEHGHWLASNDTLVKFLLRIEPLQLPLIRCLLGLLVSHASDQHIPILILNHIRWCELIYDPNTVVLLFLEILPILSVHALQMEMIMSLPSIAVETLYSDDMSEKIITQLQSVADATPGNVTH